MKTLQHASDTRNVKQNKIEKLKSLKTPLSVYEQLDTLCQNGLENLANEDSGFFLKCFGIFLKKDSTFMLRIRIPAGQLSLLQATRIGELSRDHGNDYINITTRQQIELRYLSLTSLPHILKELDEVGITTFQTGVDNFRNIVTSSFDGVGVHSFIACKPIIDALQGVFLKKEEWIGQLPRKFNTAILGNQINDCNVYGHDCCFILAKNGQEIGFNLSLGGKVGIQAKESGLFVRKEEVVETFKAIIALFKKFGFRDNRNKNRLFFLLQEVGMENFINAIKEITRIDYLPSGTIITNQSHHLDKSGILNLDEELQAVHFSIPSGIFKGTDLIRVAETAQKAEGSIRLSVEQSLYILTKKSDLILKSEVFASYHPYHSVYFNHQIACAGTATCAFAVIPNKPDAIDMANFLEKEVPLKEAKIRMYWSACPKGCGIHGVADIGFEGCKTLDAQGNRVNGVHIYLGGKVTKEAKEARRIAKAVPLLEAKEIVKKIVEEYKNEKFLNESFEAFEERVLVTRYVSV